MYPEINWSLGSKTIKQHYRIQIKTSPQRTMLSLWCRYNLYFFKFLWIFFVFYVLLRFVNIKTSGCIQGNTIRSWVSDNYPVVRGCHDFVLRSVGSTIPLFLQSSCKMRDSTWRSSTFPTSWVQFQPYTCPSGKLQFLMNLRMQHGNEHVGSLLSSKFSKMTQIFLPMLSRIF